MTEERKIKTNEFFMVDNFIKENKLDCGTFTDKRRDETVDKLVSMISKTKYCKDYCSKFATIKEHQSKEGKTLGKWISLYGQDFKEPSSCLIWIYNLLKNFQCSIYGEVEGIKLSCK